MAKVYIREGEVNSQLVWLYILQTKCPVDVIKFNPAVDQHKDENPLEMFPFLIENDLKIWGEHAVVTYIAEKYGNNAFYGLTIEEKAKINSALYWLGSTFHRDSIFNYVFPQSPSLSKEAPNYGLDCAHNNKLLMDHGLKAVCDHLSTIEKVYFTESKFLCDKQTVADFYLALILLQLENVSMKFENWPKLSEWFKDYKPQILALLM